MRAPLWAPGVSYYSDETAYIIYHCNSDDFNFQQSISLHVYQYANSSQILVSRFHILLRTIEHARSSKISKINSMIIVVIL